MILAKEIVRARKAINRIHTGKAHMNAIQLNMKNKLATLRVAGALSESAEVMQTMQQLVKYTELAGVMRGMAKEMMKAGIIEEMIDETFESLEETEEMEEVAQSEIDKVLFEITQGKLGEAPLPPEAEAGAAAVSKVQEKEDSDKESSEEDLKEMQGRLASLRS